MCDLMKKLEQKQNSVTVDQLSLKCRYHKKEDEKFDDDSFLKEFKCLELFHSLYPMVLALMYDANFSEDELVLTCPNSENTVTVRLFLEPVKGIDFWINTVKEMLRPLRPMDVVTSTVCAEVISVKVNVMWVVRWEMFFGGILRGLCVLRPSTQCSQLFCIQMDVRAAHAQVM